MKEIVKRTWTGISLVVVFAGSIWLGPLPFLALLLLIYTLGAWELLRLEKAALKAREMLLIASGFLFIAVAALQGMYQLPLYYILLPMLLWLALALTGRRRRWASLLMIWLAMPLSSYYTLAWLSGEAGYNPTLPLVVIILVWINDIFAYLGGSLVGKHQLTPSLSPGKTWEGTFTGLILCTVTGYLIHQVTGLFSPGIWILTGGLTSLLSLSGDLFESALKRSYGVKDTGTILPGHGGMLDRFDSLLFVAPMAFLTMLLYQSFGS